MSEQVPTKNTECGVECFFPQRLEEHPFMFDRFGHLKGSHVPVNPLDAKTKEMLRHNDWFWVVTGVHQGGGLDCAMVIRKKGPPMLASPARPLPLASLPAADAAASSAVNGCSSGCVDGRNRQNGRRATNRVVQRAGQHRGSNRSRHLGGSGDDSRGFVSGVG